jgi:hypothetical protein
VISRRPDFTRVPFGEAKGISMISHDFDENEICQQCGASKKAVAAFGWSCKPVPGLRTSARPRSRAEIEPVNAPNQAPISAVEWRDFRALALIAVEVFQSAGGGIALELPYVRRYAVIDFAFEYYLAPWDDNKMKGDERKKGVLIELYHKQVRVYTGEKHTANNMREHEYIDVTREEGPWNVVARRMIDSIESAVKRKRGRVFLDEELRRRWPTREREIELDRIRLAHARHVSLPEKVRSASPRAKTFWTSLFDAIAPRELGPEERRARDLQRARDISLGNRSF